MYSNIPRAERGRRVPQVQGGNRSQRRATDTSFHPLRPDKILLKSRHAYGQAPTVIAGIREDISRIQFDYVESIAPVRVQ